MEKMTDFFANRIDIYDEQKKFGENSQLKAIQIVAPVIANPQGEAIHARTLDCFTLRVRNDGAAGWLHQSPCFLFALLRAA